ncbi:MAG TPA: hypothetical protein PLV92_28940 [Pirellulaceae bacterium]|nr:hypothetical protein [Pirellulaceae bacterium]
MRAVFVTSGYAYNAAHDFLDDVAAGNRVGTPQALASKTIIANGNSRALDAADTTWAGLTGSPVVAVILYVHNASEAAARLIAFIDGLSVAPDGSDVTLRWNAAGIVELTYS